MLKNSGKSVYVTITYDSEKNWAKAFDLQNERTTESEMDELVKFLKEYKISGVIMEQIFLYVSKFFWIFIMRNTLKVYSTKIIIWFLSL